MILGKWVQEEAAGVSRRQWRGHSLKQGKWTLNGPEKKRLGGEGPPDFFAASIFHLPCMRMAG
jgi:hypothetical protein